MNFDRHDDQNSDNNEWSADDLIFKPIIEGLAYFWNWIFATLKPVEIGLKLVFYKRNFFFLGQINSTSKIII